MSPERKKLVKLVAPFLTMTFLVIGAMFIIDVNYEYPDDWYGWFILAALMVIPLIIAIVILIVKNPKIRKLELMREAHFSRFHFYREVSEVKNNFSENGNDFSFTETGILFNNSDLVLYHDLKFSLTKALIENDFILEITSSDYNVAIVLSKELMFWLDYYHLAVENFDLINQVETNIKHKFSMYKAVLGKIMLIVVILAGGIGLGIISEQTQTVIVVSTFIIVMTFNNIFYTRKVMILTETGITLKENLIQKIFLDYRDIEKIIVSDKTLEIVSDSISINFKANKKIIDALSKFISKEKIIQ